MRKRACLCGARDCQRHGGGSNWATYKAKHPERAARYKDHGWALRRAAQLRDHPDCALCGSKASDADHITPIALGGFFDGPLRSLCRRCHLKVTAEASKISKRRAAEARKRR